MSGLGRAEAAVLDEDGGHRQGWDPQRVDQAVGWGRQYRQEGAQWRHWGEAGTLVAPGVQAHGLSPRSAPQVAPQVAGGGTLPRTQPLRAEEGGECVAAEAAKAKDGERLGGRSEGSESILGKGKRGEGEQAPSGLTGLVVRLGARVSHTSAAVLRQAWASVPTKTILTWCQEKLGKTGQATRRPLFVPLRKAEQKQDQIKLAA